MLSLTSKNDASLCVSWRNVASQTLDETTKFVLDAVPILVKKQELTLEGIL